MHLHDTPIGNPSVLAVLKTAGLMRVVKFSSRHPKELFT